MAESLQTEDKTLHHIFLDGWKLFEELETTSLPFASHEYQSKVKESIGTFEKSTNVVNKISMFSPNELIDEVPTEHLQYLLLPFFLAKLSTKSNDPDRLRILELAEIYYNDFIQRCADYELTEAPKKNETSTTVEKSGAPENELASLINAAHSRNNKIAQFRKKKELDEEIKLLRVAVFNETVDDEIKRNFFLKFINRSILESKEELESINLEKQMVQMRTSASKSTTDPQKHNRVQAPARPPMKPFIITRDNTQKAVFGLGYPSLPVMTVDEFYHQRVHEGIFPDKEQIEKMNQQQMLAQLALTNPDEKEEEEKAANEVLVENDDPEYLQRQRGMDEYKDVVRRGDGNRHNRS